jgi:CheY-like chemotaxis protein
MKAPQLQLNSQIADFMNTEMNDPALNFVVIDDDSINNMVCKAAIKSATGGKIAVCFNNPVEALKYFEENCIFSRPTLLFLDINMPEMSGWEWLELYNNFPESVKENIAIYILSSSVNPSDIDKAHSNYLVKDYVVKPLTKAKVLDLMEATLSQSKVHLKIV